MTSGHPKIPVPGDYIRFSALDRIAVCPASWAESKGQPSVGSEASNFGTAGHAIYEKLARGLPVSVGDVCTQFGVGHRDQEMSDIISKACFNPRGKPEVAVELEFDNSDIPCLKGTADLVIEDQQTVIDYKFSQLRGRTPKVDERLQVPAYSWAVARAYAWEQVTAQIFNPILGEKGWSSRTYDKAEIDNGIEDLQELSNRAAVQDRLPRSKRSYTPSEHCVFCPGKTTCPAIRAQLQSIATLSPQDLAVEHDRLPALVQFSKDLVKRAESVIDFAKSTVLLTGDIIGPDGVALVMSHQMRAPTVSAKAVLDWLESHDHADIVLAIRADLEDRPKIKIHVMNVKKVKKEIAANV